MDLSSLLHDVKLDEIEEVLVPEGYWSGIIISANLYESDASGAPLIDKNNKIYAQAVIYARCTHAIDGVDPAEEKRFIEANGPEENLVRYSAFLNSRSRVVAFGNLLASLGVPTIGRDLGEVLEGLRGSELPVKMLIEHRESKGGTVEDASTLTPMD